MKRLSGEKGKNKGKEDTLMKENKTLEKMLETIAEVFSESTSCFGLYEPKVPEKLVEKHKKNV